MPIYVYNYPRQDGSSTVIVTPTDPAPTTIGGTAVATGDPSGASFVVNSSGTGLPSFNQVNPNPTTTPSTATSSSPSASNTVVTHQSIPVRTLVAICVAGFILVAGLVLFILWFGARSRKNKNQVHEDVALNISKSTSGEDVFKSGYNGGVAPSHPALKGINSEQSSYYSQQSAGRKPMLLPQHDRRPTQDSLDNHKLTLDPYHHQEENSFLPKANLYNRSEPLSPRSQGRPPGGQSQYPDPNSPTGNTSLTQSPRSTSAQAIIRPYVVGAHPFASPGRGTPSSRPSIEHVGNSTVAIAYPEQPEGQGLGLSGANGNTFTSTTFSTGSGSGANAFPNAGTRPGYNAYGIESRQPITALNTRPSLESIRSLSRKHSMDQNSVAMATDFAIGGPTAVGTRSRNNSTSSRDGRDRGSAYERSLFSGGGGSIRSTKSGKEKLSKAEKQRDLKAMNNLIAALDQSADEERKRKEALARAAGLDDPPLSAGSAKSGGSIRGRERDAVTGQFTLPPADVFRAALSTSSARVHDDDWVDDEEIERWRRK